MERTHGEQTMENGWVSQDSELDNPLQNLPPLQTRSTKNCYSDIQSALRETYLETGQADCIVPDMFSERPTVVNTAITSLYVYISSSQYSTVNFNSFLLQT